MIWKVLLVGFFAVIGGGVYGIFFSSLPAKIALQLVPEDKLRVESVEGSMLSGFTFKGIWADAPAFKLEL